MTQLSFTDHTIMNKPNVNETVSLWDLVSRFSRGMIRKPPHQREFIWPEEKKKSFIDRLNSTLPCIGMIVLYNLRENPVIYLNDGYQRISTCLEYKDYPEMYGHTKNHAEMVLVSNRMPTQHFNYLDLWDAHFDFQIINMGSPMTAKEHFRGFLAIGLDSFESMWEKRFFSRLHSIVPSYSNIIVSSHQSSNRFEQHKILRGDFSLFHRWVLGKNAPLRYKDVSKMRVDLPDINSRCVEKDLVNILSKMGINEALRQLDLLDRFVSRETRAIETVCNEVLGNNVGISLSVYRWLLDLGIYRKAHNITVKSWANFISSFLENGGGGPTLVYKDGKINKKSFVSIANLSQLGKLQEVVLGVKLEKHKKRQKTKLSPKSGVDRSHLLPFSTHGDGEIVMESSLFNRARGAKEAPLDDNGNIVHIKDE